MIQSGTQVLLTNEYDETKQFHKFIMAEQCMRSLACANENVYIIGLFACCRQIYNPAIHCNMVSKAKAEELSQGFRNIARKLAQFFDKKLGQIADEMAKEEKKEETPVTSGKKESEKDKQENEEDKKETDEVGEEQEAANGEEAGPQEAKSEEEI